MSYEETVSKIRTISATKQTSIEFEGQTYDFEIKRLSAKILVTISSLEGLDKVSPDGQGTQLKHVYPMMEAVIPSCCIHPKISLEKGDDPNTLLLEEIPVGLSVELLGRIFEHSGLKGDEAKN